MAYNQHPSGPIEEQFLKEMVMELIGIMSNETLKELELSPNIVRIKPPSYHIHCVLKGIAKDALFNHTIRINAMSSTLAYSH